MTAAREKVGALLRHLGQKAGVELDLDSEGVCAVTYGETVTCVIEVPAHADTLYLSSTMLSLPHLDESRLASLFRRLLALDFLALDTGGAIFALDERNREIVLWYSSPVERLDAVAFENVFGAFLETAVAWSAKLPGFLMAEGEHGPGDGQTGDGRKPGGANRLA